MPQYQPIQLNDGVHLRFEGIGLPFRFRLGQGKFGRLPYGDHFVFTIDGAAGHYLVQLLFREYSVPAAQPSPVDILGLYMREEVAYEMKHHGSPPLEQDALEVFTHATGAPIVTMLRRRPAHLQSEERGSTPTTPYTVHAIQLHPPYHLLDFVLTGMDAATWTEADLRTQARRIASSYALA